VALPSLTWVASGLLIAAFVLVLAAGLDLTWQRYKTPELRRRSDVDRFARAIDRQRFACLGMILLLVGAGGVALVGLLGGWCHTDDLAFTFVSGVPFMIAEAFVKFAERRFKSVPTANAKVRKMWAQVLDDWEHSPVPDWSF
jgi:membrane protein required for beta-lactamase induction